MGLIQFLVIAITLSIDGFWAGAAMGIEKTKLSLRNILEMSASTFLMTAVAAIIGSFAAEFVGVKALTILGGVLLFVVGLSYVKPKKKPNKKQETQTFKNGLLMGIALGADSAVASFALAVTQINPVLIALGMTIAQSLFVWWANVIALKIKIDVPDKFKGLGGYVLIVMAVAKILT